MFWNLKDLKRNKIQITQQLKLDSKSNTNFNILEFRKILIYLLTKFLISNILLINLAQVTYENLIIYRNNDLITANKAL